MNEYYKDELPENTVSTLLKILKDNVRQDGDVVYYGHKAGS